MLKPQTKSEADVLREVKTYLSNDNRVIWHGRFNSGKGHLNNGFRSVWFVANECHLNTDSGAVDSVCTDILAINKYGRAVVIEVKKSNWKKPTTEVEKKQHELIESLKEKGVIAGFVRSIEELNQLLGGSA